MYIQYIYIYVNTIYIYIFRYQQVPDTRGEPPKNSRLKLDFLFGIVIHPHLGFPAFSIFSWLVCDFTTDRRIELPKSRINVFPVSCMKVPSG